MIEFKLILENDKLINVFEFYEFCRTNSNKEIKLSLNQESHCLTYCGVYDILDQYQFAKVVIESFNKLESHKNYEIHNSIGFWGLWLTKFKRIKPNFNKIWNGNNTFGVLYSRPTANRIGIIGHLLDKHSDNSLIKFRSDFTDPDIRKRAELGKLFDWDSNTGHKLQLIMNNYDKIYSNYPAYSPESGLYKFKTDLHDLYEDFLIDIVSEAVMYGNSFYPTEKICRPLMFQRPFIVMASKGYLKNLRELGYKTFSNYWDESYDDLEGAERYHAILALIDTISKIQIHNIYKDMKEVLEHNRKVILK